MSYPYHRNLIDSDLHPPKSHTHIESEITDLDKYTQAEVDVLLFNKSDTSHNHNLNDLVEKSYNSLDNLPDLSQLHTQNTDTALGLQIENLDMNTHKIVGVVDPTTNQEVATKKYVDDNAGITGISYNEEENRIDFTLDAEPVGEIYLGYYTPFKIIGVEQLKDENGDVVNVFDINDAVAKKHTQGTDTTLGTQTEDLDMGTSYKITNLADPISNQDASTKAYVDSQISGENHWDRESDDTLVPYIADSNLDMGSGDIDTTGNISGINVTSGLNPGHTHNTDSLSIDASDIDYTPGSATDYDSGVDTVVEALDELGEDKHTHVNKNLLDTYTQTDVDIADTISKEHEHTNKTEIDKVTIGDHDVITSGNPHQVKIEELDLASGTVASDVDDAVNKKHDESHNIASHNDTSATGAELNELTDGSNTALHIHDIYALDTDLSTHESDTTSIHGIVDTSDLGLKSGNINQFNDITSAGVDIEDSVTKKHTQNTDTDLDSTFEATFVKKVDTVNVLSDITSIGADIEDAVTKRHEHTNKTEIDKVTIGDHDVITSGNPHNVIASEIDFIPDSGDSFASGVDTVAEALNDLDQRTVDGSGVYTNSFTDGDLSSGILTVTHNLGGLLQNISIYDNNNLLIIADEIDLIDTNNLTIDLSSYGSITGTWNYIVVGVGGLGAGGLLNIVEDLTPQLGGDLDLNGKNINFPTTANISDCLDEDDMISNSPTKLSTQQSIKAFGDSIRAYADTKGDIKYSDTRSYIGTFTRDLTIASGSQAVTGLGFSPKSIEFHMAHQASQIFSSFGFGDGNNSRVLYFDGTNWERDNLRVIYYNNGGNAQIGTILSLDADGFTINWTKYSSPTGSIDIQFRALR